MSYHVHIPTFAGSARAHTHSHTLAHPHTLTPPCTHTHPHAPSYTHTPSYIRVYMCTHSHTRAHTLGSPCELPRAPVTEIHEGSLRCGASLAPPFRQGRQAVPQHLHLGMKRGIRPREVCSAVSQGLHRSRKAPGMGVKEEQGLQEYLTPGLRSYPE